MLLSLCVPTHALGQDKSGVDPTRLRLPKGPGSLEGVGENVEPNLNMGLMTYRVAVVVPSGYSGLTPDLSLTYSSGAGNSEVGIGWSLSVPRIERMTSRGLPRYTTEDVFAANGGDELVAVSGNVYRARFEGAFVRYTWHDRGSGALGYWMAEYPDGRIGYFGATAEGELVDTARVRGRDGVFSYHLVEMVDVFDHRLRYDYEKDGEVSRLSRVTYVFSEGKPRYEVRLSYEPRPDPISDAKSGVELRWSERLAEIQVLARGVQVRRYQLRYEDTATSGGLSRLENVAWFGLENEGPHPIDFDFSYSAGLGDSKPSVVVMEGSLGIDFQAGAADLVDMNADGLPDVVDTSQARHRIFLNEWSPTGHRFAGPETSEIGALSLQSPSTQMFDLDGDGSSDMIDAENRVVLWNGGDGDWSMLEAVDALSTIDFATDPHLRFFDFDNDKHIDVLRAGAGGSWVLHNRGQGEFTLVEENLDPLGVSFADDPLQLADMNGDGLQDVVLKATDLVSYRMNLGRGRWSDWIDVDHPPANLPADARLVDLNGDALVDLVIVSGNAVSYATNRDGTHFDDLRTIAASSTLPIPEKTSHSLRFADMNGSGSTDVVWIDGSGKVTYLELFPVRPNLLTRIDNGIGKVVHIGYGSSVLHMQRSGGAGAWDLRLPQPMLTVDEIAVVDELSGVEQRQLIRYENGYYDPDEKQFRGFADVVVETPGDASVEDGMTLHHFDVGVGNPYRKGLVLEERTESDGRAIGITQTSYQQCVLDDVGETSPDIRFMCPTTITQTVQEGTDPAEWVTTVEEYEYDGYGNRTLERNLGVTAIGGGGCAPCNRSADVYGAPCGPSCGGDESTREVRFVSPKETGGRWILRKPARVRRYGSDDASLVSEEITHYDGETLQGLPVGYLTEGLVSRVEARVEAGTDQWVDLRRMRYDDHGALVEALDANGHRRTFDYDPTGRLLLRESQHFDDRDEPYVLEVTATYHPVLDQPVASTSWAIAGQADAASVTHYAWDAFGRISATASPGDTLEAPTATYSYEVSAPVSRIIERTRSHSGADFDLETVQCFDGLGRKLQTRTLVGDGAYQVSGFAEFNSRGLEYRSYQAFVGKGGTCSTTAPDSLFVEKEFDALGRVLTTLAPDESIYGSSTRRTETYLPLRQVSADGEDNDPASPHYDTPTITHQDGLGRTVAIERSLRDASGDLKWEVSRVTFDALGHLRSHVDARGHEKIQRYDLLGRIVEVDDPDAGKTDFEYDAEGNLVRRTDARGKTARFTYDEAGRLLSRFEEGNREKTVVSYLYDALPECKECTNLPGQLARITYPGGEDASRGEDRFGYDPRKRATYRRRKVDGHVFEFGFEVDGAGRITARSYPSGHRLEYEFDGASRLVSVPGYVDRIRYDQRGLLHRVETANGVTTQKLYDAVARLSTLDVVDDGGESVLDHGYTYDREGHVISVRDREAPGDEPSATAAFDYDDWYRLIRAELDGGEEVEEIVSYEYDAIGNILSKSSSRGEESAAHVGTYEYGGGDSLAGPRAVIRAGDLRLEYDAAGNLTKRGQASFAWDFDGRMTSAAVRGEQVAQFTQGPGSGRLKKIERGHTAYYLTPGFEVRDGSALIYVTVGANEVAKIEVPEYAATMLADVAPGELDGHSYQSEADGMVTAGDAWVVQMLREGTYQSDDDVPEASARELLAASTRRMLVASTERVTYFHHDRLGSVAATTNESGEVEQKTQYYPYGAPRFRGRRASDERGYVGKETDPMTGLSYFGERYLDPFLGRWASVDPMSRTLDGGAESLPLAKMAHNYVVSGNSPTSLVDPDGADPVQPSDLAHTFLTELILNDDNLSYQLRNIRGGAQGFASVTPNDRTNCVVLPAAALYDALAYHGLEHHYTGAVHRQFVMATGAGMNAAARDFANGLIQAGIAERVTSVQDVIKGDMIQMTRQNGTGHRISVLSVERDEGGRVTQINAIESTTKRDRTVHVRNYGTANNSVKYTTYKVLGDGLYEANTRGTWHFDRGTWDKIQTVNIARLKDPGTANTSTNTNAATTSTTSP